MSQEAVCPLDFRYGREEMKSIFSRANQIQRMLEVEAALAMAHGEVGNIPKSDAEVIKEKGSIEIVKPERVDEIEGQIKHDIMALVKAYSEQCGESGKYIHLGATSNDIIDTSAALQLKDAVEIIEKDLEMLKSVILISAKEHKGTIMVGRTHGQFAIPTTFGLKMAVYAMEVQRHADRLKACKDRLLVGKMSGAVGTGAALGEHALEIQDKVMKQLGIGVEEAATQIIGRDRYLEFLSVLSNIATSLEKFATEIRNLQRGEIGEVAESFDRKKQVGSSTMAHKRNPITSENICGLARITRAFLTPAFESSVLWHERDLTNTSAERFILPHSCILIDDILVKMTTVFKNLEVYPENMKRNLEASKGLIMVESVMMALTKNGMGRQKAHELLRQCAMEAESQGRTLKETLLNIDEIMLILTQEEIDKALDPESYIGKATTIVDSVIEKLKVD
jgi:adenylosuccinate lyase